MSALVADPPESVPGMWAHACRVERGLLWTGNGEPCSWCGACKPAKAAT